MIAARTDDKSLHMWQFLRTPFHVLKFMPLQAHFFHKRVPKAGGMIYYYLRV